MSDWDRPDTWEKLAKSAAALMAGGSAILGAISKLKKSKRKKRDIAAELDAVMEAVEIVGNGLITQSNLLVEFLQDQLKLLSNMVKVLSRHDAALGDHKNAISTLVRAASVQAKLVDELRVTKRKK